LDEPIARAARGQGSCRGDHRATTAPEAFHNGFAYPSGATGHKRALAGEFSVGGRAHRCISTRTPLGLLTIDARAISPYPCSSLAGRHNGDVISLTRLPVNNPNLHAIRMWCESRTLSQKTEVFKTRNPTFGSRTVQKLSPRWSIGSAALNDTVGELSGIARTL
jgi:hypothetical protein